MENQEATVTECPGPEGNPADWCVTCQAESEHWGGQESFQRDWDRAHRS